MSILSFLRRSPSSAPRLSDLEEQIREVERRAQGETGHMRARLLNQAGDLCVQAGETGRAKGYFGRTIDTYLEAGYFEAAAAICRKMIRLAPDVVRARATLALIYLGKKLVENAEYEVELVQDYIRAARATGHDDLLVQRLRLMTEATENQELRVLLGQNLMELGDEEYGRHVLYSIYREVSGLEEPRDLNPEEQWERLLLAATMSPKDLLDQEKPRPSLERETQALPSLGGGAAGRPASGASLSGPPSRATSPIAAAPAPTPAPAPPAAEPIAEAALSLDLPPAPRPAAPAPPPAAPAPALDGDFSALDDELSALDAGLPATGGPAAYREDAGEEDDSDFGDPGDLPLLGGPMPDDLDDFGNIDLGDPASEELPRRSSAA